MKSIPADIDTLIFDFDGTIADTMELGIRISNALAPRFGYQQIESKEHLNSLRNKTTQEAIRAIGIAKYKIPLIASKFRKQLHRDIASLEAQQGVKSMIETLSPTYRMGIVSSNSSKNIQSFLSANDLTRHFLYFSTGISLFRKHVTLNQIIRKNSIRKEQVLLIGDETRDVEAAKKAGVAVVAVSWGFHSPEVLAASEPDFLIHSPEELIALLVQ